MKLFPYVERLETLRRSDGKDYVLTKKRKEADEGVLAKEIEWLWHHAKI